MHNRTLEELEEAKELMLERAASRESLARAVNFHGTRPKEAEQENHEAELYHIAAEALQDAIYRLP